MHCIYYFYSFVILYGFGLRTVQFYSAFWLSNSSCIKYFIGVYLLFIVYMNKYLFLSVLQLVMSVYCIRESCVMLFLYVSHYTMRSCCVCDIITFPFWHTMSFQTLSVQYESPQNYVIYVFYIAHRSCTGKA